MRKAIRNCSGFVALILLMASAIAQEDAGKGLGLLIQANERFGRKLLYQVHSNRLEHNVVVSPMPITLLFAAFREHSWMLREEIDATFGWKDSLSLSIPARQFLAAFEQPEKTQPCPPSLAPPCFGEGPEGAWITNTLLYRSYVEGSHEVMRNPIDKRFALGAKKNFGFRFAHTGTNPPGARDLQRMRKSLGKLPDMSVPKGSPPNDVWFSSGTHLETAWKGNTFSISRPYQGQFTTDSGQTKQVEMLDSQMQMYLHAKTDSFEAVALPCNNAYMIALLPAPGQDIRGLERELADHPDSMDAALSRELGMATMPIFRVDFEDDFGEPLKTLGIHEVFDNLGELFRIPNSHLTKIAQRTDLAVNKEGIRANAETVFGAVYGGIGTGGEPFHTRLNRPFVFLIRDQTTNALLFIGAVMDPAAN